MLFNYFTVLVFMAFGAVFVAVNLLIGRLIRPHNPTPIKMSPYECGEVSEGHSWKTFNPRFYIIGLVFLIFDVEIIFLFPWAVVFRDVGLFGFIEALIFIAILLVGYAWVWARGDLEWVRMWTVDDIKAEQVIDTEERVEEERLARVG